MAEDPMRAKARATFGKAFMDAVKPKPLAKDAATASQKVANQRPIPTYKVGGVVKKADGGVMPSRIAARIKAGNYKDGGETFDYNKGGKVKTSADTARKLATEMGGMKKGGSCGMKPVKKAVGGTAFDRNQAYRTLNAQARKYLDMGVPKDLIIKQQAALRALQMDNSSTQAQHQQALNRAMGTLVGAMNEAQAAKKAAPASSATPSPAFDRNQAYRTLNAQARKYLDMGVPKDLIIKQQAALRALQMDNSSTQAQHQQALNRAMGTLVGAMNEAQAAKKATTLPKGQPTASQMPELEVRPSTPMPETVSPPVPRYAMETSAPAKLAVGGAGKTRKDQAPIKRAHGGVAKKDTMPREGVSTRPTGPGGRRITFEELEQSNRDTGGMSAEQLRAAGRAIGRGNRTPKEPIPRAKGGAAKVRKGMMSESGNIKQAVKPKKGIGGFM